MDTLAPQDSQHADKPEGQPRGRHIPKEVASKLLEDARYRCCLCRVLIDPGSLDDETLFDSLEKHHLIHFSEGGEHTADNLLLVCANCHSKIHRHLDRYPVETLQERKRHWIGMREVLPSELRMAGEGKEVIWVPFSLETLNLQYLIAVFSQTTVSELALFVRDRIFEPLGEYDNYENWVELESVRLARRSAPKEHFDPELPVGEIQLARDDALIGMIHVPVVPVVVPTWWDLGKHPYEPEMVFVPAGEFWMGTNRLALESAGIEWQDWFRNETPYHPVYLPDYAIGRYPVTNAEFAAFIKDGGYRDPQFWTEDGWSATRGLGWVQPGSWDDRKYNSPRQPVVAVSWYEAVAYCIWLSQATGKPYHLPSEAEWEKAARGTDGRIYPWGNGPPDKGRCNFGDNVGTTTAVGRYSPQGDSPCGCADMAGNVWEWTRSLWDEDWNKPDFKYPYDPRDGRENLEASHSARRVMRGGAFYTEDWRARCAYRSRPRPHHRDKSVGFRLVASPVHL